MSLFVLRAYIPNSALNAVLHLGKQAGAADKGIATLRVQNGEMASCSMGKREMLVDRSRKLEARVTKERFYADIGKETEVRVEANKCRGIKKRRQWFKMLVESSQERK